MDKYAYSEKKTHSPTDIKSVSIWKSRLNLLFATKQVINVKVPFGGLKYVSNRKG